MSHVMQGSGAPPPVPLADDDALDDDDPVAAPPDPLDDPVPGGAPPEADPLDEAEERTGPPKSSSVVVIAQPAKMRTAPVRAGPASFIAPEHSARGARIRHVITIELFGVPRLRAGRDAIAVEASSLGEAIRALGAACPALGTSVVADGKLGAHYLVALNGRQITADATTPLSAGDVLVLLSAEAGG
jgi:sulfur-carrier protein